jgi:hypothetical protein
MFGGIKQGPGKEMPANVQCIWARGTGFGRLESRTETETDREEPYIIIACKPERKRKVLMNKNHRQLARETADSNMQFLHETLSLLMLITNVRLEVFTAVTMKNGVFWDVTLCGSCTNRRFGGTYKSHTA